MDGMMTKTQTSCPRANTKKKNTEIIFLVEEFVVLVEPFEYGV